MSVQAVTLNLPETIYEKIRQAAERIQRPVDEIMVEAVVAAAPVAETTTPKMQSVLAHLAYLNDGALWQAARSTMTIAQRERLEALHDKQQQQPLASEEQAEERALLALYHETILIRAQAAVLLKQRGYNISDPQQFTPLE